MFGVQGKTLVVVPVERSGLPPGLGALDRQLGCVRAGKTSVSSALVNAAFYFGGVVPVVR